MSGSSAPADQVLHLNHSDPFLMLSFEVWLAYPAPSLCPQDVEWLILEVHVGQIVHDRVNIGAVDEALLELLKLPLELHFGLKACMSSSSCFHVVTLRDPILHARAVGLELFLLGWRSSTAAGSVTPPWCLMVSGS